MLMARIYDSLGRSDEALRIYKGIAAWQPPEPSTPEAARIVKERESSATTPPKAP